MEITIEYAGKQLMIKGAFDIAGSFQDLQWLSGQLTAKIEQGGGDLFAYAWGRIEDRPTDEKMASAIREQKE